jgi:hypothetical protein
MYEFIVEGTGESVEVDFSAMMAQDRAGFITLPDGRKARRVNKFQAAKAVVPANAPGVPLPSDNLGFTSHQLAEFEHDRVSNGFVGIEFKQDPRCDTFYQVHFSSWAARDKYIRHRGKVDHGKSSGATITAEMLQEACKIAKERWV